ncbi:hypothetical protein AQS8620_02263 [Aquimixticola soesokkakensis]|uniref:Sulfotransferase family protein n=1 Tax=Aquimixticola soesokkakensis TaxID=1519096 RepID=A0A1Y5SZ39_9RHOB|nr:hypothetical protein [Aquimixticola soesokkakensis]SLN52025.1 hypothetical protein AQS8620_02263 [Aquimixticola soesokkakensis]
MTRIIVHAGFHKTGTTSLQDFIKANSRALAPYLTAYGKSDFRGAGAHARRYGQAPFALRRLAFRRSFARFLAALPSDGGTVLLSRETFAGCMPGHRDWRGRVVQRYSDTGPRLLGEVVRGLRRRFGPQARIDVLLTTRPFEPWLASVYGHLLRSIHLQEDLSAFRAQLPRCQPLADEAAVFARSLAPLGVEVHIADLADCADDPAGPAKAVLDLLDLPTDLRATLAPARRANRRQTPEIEEQFIAINRQNLTKSQKKSLKDALLASATAP